MTVSLAYERSLWEAGASVVAGIDEVGRGALAGPVSVGVVAVAPCDDWPEGLADSKELTPAAREALSPTLASFGIARAVGHATAAEIDQVGIIAALRLAALRALASVGPVDAVILDGKHDWLSAPPPDLFELEPQPTPPVTMVIKGDRQCASVAAASVLAKIERDALMVAAHEQFPHYGWDGNKGYGAHAHLEALRLHGPCELHRRSWSLPLGSAELDALPAEL